MVKGIDVSGWQHPQGRGIDWESVWNAGYKFVYVKATEGVGFVNQYAIDDCRAARAAGLSVGLYHFARPQGNRPRQEAHHFLNTAIKCDINLPHALDLEDHGRLRWGTLAQYAKEWMDEADAGVIYLTRWYRSQLAPYGLPGNKLLWLAAPTPVPPGVGETIWQYGQGPVPGIVGPVDLNEWDSFISQPKERVTVQVDMPVLRQGMGSQAMPNPQVKKLQTLLNISMDIDNKSPGTHLVVDGIFGRKTESAVRAWQTFFRLPVNGVTDAPFWTTILTLP